MPELIWSTSARFISGGRCPQLATSTPEEKSIHLLPQRSFTVKFSALSHTTSGWPLMEIGSYFLSSLSIGIDSGTGMSVVSFGTWS